MSSDDDEESRPCSDGATCASGGDVHCRMYTRYPWLSDPDIGDGCCVVGCPLDVDKVNVE